MLIKFVGFELEIKRDAVFLGVGGGRGLAVFCDWSGMGLSLVNVGGRDVWRQRRRA